MASKRLQWSLFSLLAMIAVFAVALGVFSHFWRRPMRTTGYAYPDGQTIRRANKVEIYRLGPPESVIARSMPYARHEPFAGPFSVPTETAAQMKDLLIFAINYDHVEEVSYTPGTEDLQIRFTDGQDVMNIYLDGRIVQIRRGEEWVGLEVLTKQAHAALLKCINEVAPETSDAIPPPDEGAATDR